MSERQRVNSSDIIAPPPYSRLFTGVGRNERQRVNNSDLVAPAPYSRLFTGVGR